MPIAAGTAPGQGGCSTHLAAPGGRLVPALPAGKKIGICVLTHTAPTHIFWINKFGIPKRRRPKKDRWFDGTPARKRAYRA